MLGLVLLEMKSSVVHAHIRTKSRPVRTFILATLETALKVIIFQVSRQLSRILVSIMAPRTLPLVNVAVAGGIVAKQVVASESKVDISTQE